MADNINASDVANAYTVPLDGVTNSFRYYDQLAARKKARQDAIDSANQAQNYQKVKILNDAFNGLDIGTGTPWDKVGNNLVATAKQNVIDYQKKNPNASPTDLWNVANEETRGISAGIDNAKKAYTYQSAITAATKKQFPQLDQAKVGQYYQSKIFYDDKGNLLPTPNMQYAPTEFDNSDMRSQFLSQEDAQGALHTALDKSFPATQYAIPDPSNPGVFVRGATKAYLDGGGKPLSSPVSWTTPTNNVNSIDANNPLMAPVNPVGALPAGGDTESLHGVPPEVMAKLQSVPVFNDMLASEVRRIKQANPDMLKGASDDQVAQIAALNLTTNYGSAGDVKAPKVDFGIADHTNKLQQQAISNGYRAASLANSNERLNIARQGLADREGTAAAKAAGKAAAAKLFVPDIIANADKGDPTAQAIVQAHSQPIKVYGQSVPAVNITGINGAPLKDPSSGQKMNVYTTNDPQYGKVLIYKYLSKDPATGQLVETDAGTKVVGAVPHDIINPHTGQVLIHKGNIQNEMKGFDQQFTKPNKHFLWQGLGEDPNATDDSTDDGE